MPTCNPLLREKYPFALWRPGTAFPCKTDSPQVSFPRGLDPATLQEAASDPGTGSYIPPIDIVGLASLCVFLDNWHSPAHVRVTRFTSPPKPSDCTAMPSASVNLSSCFWETVPNQSWTPSGGRSGFTTPLPNPKDLHSAWILH